MSGLYFKIGADFDNIRKLKQELDEMKSKLLSMDKAANPKAFNQLNIEVQKTQKIFNSLAEEAAKAGASFEHNFKNQIYNSSQVVNDLSRKIIEQKSVVQLVKTDVDRLAESYKKISSIDPNKKNALSDLNSAKKTLTEEKNALFDLQQQQSKARLSTKELSDEFKRFHDESKNAIQGTDVFASSLKSMLLKIGGTATLLKLGKDIINTRSEFQQLEIAFGTMLKSGEKAKELLSGISDFAARTPFGLQSAASAAKQLIAYGSEAGSVIQELTMLGDVAAGTGQQIEDLVYLYGTLRTQGRAYMMDIRQFAGRGIPIYKELATVLNTTEDQVNDFVSAGKVGFEQVEQAFRNMTSSGGMYGGLMEEQSKALTGQIETLMDNIQMMFNEIGEGSQGVIGSAINSAAILVENYDKVGKAIIGLVATYGTMRTALILSNALKAKDIALDYAKLVVTGKVNAAMKVLNATLLQNPFVLMTTLAVGLAAAMWSLSNATNDYEKAQSKLNSSVKEAEKGALSEQRELARLSGALNGATRGSKEFNDIKQQLVGKFGKYRENLDEEIEKVGSLDVLYQSLSKSISKSFGARQYDKFVQDQQSDLENVLSANLGKIQDRMIEKLGDKAGAEYYARLRDAILKREVSVSDGLKVKGLDTTTLHALDKISNREGFFSNFEIEQYIKNIVLAQQLTDRLGEKAKIQFGVDSSILSKTTEENAKESFDNITEKVKEAKETVLKLKKEIADLQSGEKQVASGTLIKTIEDKTKDLQDAEKKLELLTGIDKKTIKESTSANKLKSETADRLQEIEEMKRKISSGQKDMERDLQQERINLMEDGTEKTLAQITLDYDKREQEIIRRGEELIKQQQEIERKIWETENPKWKDKGMVFTPTTQTVSQLPETDQKYLAGLFQANNQAQEKSNEDTLKSMLIKYQDYAKQRLELEKEFNKDVSFLESQRNGKNDDEINSAIAKAKKIYQEGLSSINMEEFRDDIDWSIVFGELDKVSTKALYSLRDKLKKHVSEMSSSLTPENMKEIMDAFNNLDFKIAERNPLGELSGSLKKYKKSTEDVAKAREKLNELEKLGYDREEDLKEVTDELSEAQRKRQESLAAMTKAVNEMGAKGTEIVNAGQDVIDILSTIGLDIPESLRGTLEGLGKITAGLENIDLTKPFSVISSTTSILSGLATTVASIFGGGNKDAALQKQIEQYEDIISLYDKLIDKQKQYLSTLTGSDAEKQAAEVEKLIERQLAVQQNSLEAWFQTGASGKHHSMAYRLARDFGKELGIGNKKEDAYKIFDWDASDWQALQNNIDLWAKLPEEVRNYGQAVIDAKEETESIGDTLQEIYTGISFDSFRDSFLNALTDMDSSAEDFADNVEKYLQKAILNSLIADKFDGRIKSLYDKFSASNSDGTIDKEEYNELMAMRDQMVEDMIKEREALKEVFNWGSDSDSSASDNTLKGAFAKASQESIDLLAGRLGAMSVSVENIREYVAGIFTKGVDINQQEITSITDGIFVIKDMFIQELQQIKGINSQILSNSQAILDNTKNIATSSDLTSKGIEGLITSDEFNEVSKIHSENIIKIASNTKDTVNRLEGKLNVKMSGLL